MNFNFKYITPKTQEEKYSLMEFMYNNTDSFVMNTFGYLWEVRDWWEKYPILVSTFENTNHIVGLHAFTVNTKAERTLKTYYIATDKHYTGKGIAKRMTIKAVEDNKIFCDKFYVNSNSYEGIGFYCKVVGEPFNRKSNEFGGYDCEFECHISTILK